MLTIKNRAAKNLLFFLALATVFMGCTPRGPRALLNGKKLIERGRYPEAVEKLRLATSLIGTNAQAWNYLGLAYHYNGQVTNAAQAYQTALDLDHDLMEARYNLGCLWLERDRLEAARSDLTAYTLREANSGDGWLKLATVQWRLRDLPGAEKSFNESLRISPLNPEALNGLGVVLSQRNHPREAEQCFNNALKQRPEYPPALLNLAIVSQVQLNNRSQALEKYEEYLALPERGSEWESVNALARVLEQEMAAASRRAVGNSAPSSNPNPVKSASNSVLRAAMTLKPEPASNQSRLPSQPVVKAVPDAPGTNVLVRPVASIAPPNVITQSPSPEKRAPEHAGPIAVRREIKTASSQPAVNSPRPEAPKAASSSPAGEGVSRYRYHSVNVPAPGDRSAAERALAQGVQAQQARRLAEAIQAYRQAAQLDPAYYEAYYNWGLTAADAGNLPQALAAYETALAIRPDSLDARYNFALALKQANYIADSADELEKLLATYPDEPRAHLALGNLCAQQLQQPGRARQHYLKVLEIDPRTSQGPAIRYWLQANPP